MTNPFVYPNVKHPANDVASRLYLLTDFSKEETEQALKIDNLQPIVKQRLIKRLNQIGDA